MIGGPLVRIGGLADVPADAQARQGACADGFVDPARPDGEQLGGFGGGEQRRVESVHRRVVVVGWGESSGVLTTETARATWGGA